MCVTAVVNLLFNITLVVALCFTLVAIFLPQWVSLRNVSDSEYSDKFDHGLINCLKQIQNCGNTFWTVIELCQFSLLITNLFLNFHQNLHDWQRTTLVCLSASACCSLGTLLVSTVLCCCLCCCRSCFQWTLPCLTAVALALQIIGISVYAAHSRDEILSADGKRYEPKLGSSFWIGLAGSGVLLVGLILGIFLARMAKSSTPI